MLSLTLLDLTDCSLLVSSVHGILQARILEWVAMPSSKGTQSVLVESPYVETWIQMANYKVICIYIHTQTHTHTCTHKWIFDYAKGWYPSPNTVQGLSVFIKDTFHCDFNLQAHTLIIDERHCHIFCKADFIFDSPVCWYSNIFTCIYSLGYQFYNDHIIVHHSSQIFLWLQSSLRGSITKSWRLENLSYLWYPDPISDQIFLGFSSELFLKSIPWFLWQHSCPDYQ